MKVIDTPLSPTVLSRNLNLSLKDQWISAARAASVHPMVLSRTGNKVLRAVHWTVTLDDSLKLSDVNYSSAKMKMLRKYYHHEESQAIAIELWEKRLRMRRHGSVSFTTFNHLKKDGVSYRASTFGPCLQSVIITYLQKDQYIVDVCYRSTEFFKKFPADLILIRDILLPPFSLPKDTPISFYFANFTISPIYILNLFNLIDDPISLLEEIREKDRHFWLYIIKWLNLYLRGTDIKFQQINREANFFKRAYQSKHSQKKRDQIVQYAKRHKKK